MENQTPIRTKWVCQPVGHDNEKIYSEYMNFDSAKMDELEQQLSDRRVELSDAKTVAGCVSDLRDLLSEGSLAERKTFIRNFVKEVKVIGDDVLLTYTMPILPGGVTEDRLSVLSIVHYGGPWGTVPELLFEKKGLIPALQQLMLSH